jgi:hypothetical protein
VGASCPTSGRQCALSSPRPPLPVVGTPCTAVRACQTAPLTDMTPFSAANSGAPHHPSKVGIVACFDRLRLGGLFHCAAHLRYARSPEAHR